MTYSCWVPQVIRGECVLITLFALERVWNGHVTDTRRNVYSERLHSLVWNEGIWNGSRGLVPDLWIGVWIGMCVSLCSRPIILTGSHISTQPGRSPNTTMSCMPDCFSQTNSPAVCLFLHCLQQCRLQFKGLSLFISCFSCCQL